MIAVAVSLLPVLSLLLYGMDRIEDRLRGEPRPARHARTRHLRLVHSTSRPPADQDRPGRSGRSGWSGRPARSGEHLDAA